MEHVLRPAQQGRLNGISSEEIQTGTRLVAEPRRPYATSPWRRHTAARGDVTNVANTTIGLDYTGIDNGGLLMVSFGGGTDMSGDAQNIMATPCWLGAAEVVA